MAAFTGGRTASSASSPGVGFYPPQRRWQRPTRLLALLAQRVPQIAAGWAGDVTLLHREMISTLHTLEGLTRRPGIVDVDDAIHPFRGGWAAKRLAERADLVVVGND